MLAYVKDENGNVSWQKVYTQEEVDNLFYTKTQADAKFATK